MKSSTAHHKSKAKLACVKKQENPPEGEPATAPERSRDHEQVFCISTYGNGKHGGFALRVEFLLKTDCGYPKDMGDNKSRENTAL